jgi:hypothetical protein
MDFTKASKILELNETIFNLKDLKKKYHELALKNHPDKNGNTSQSKETFQQINEAYMFLSNELEEDNNYNTSFAMPSYVDILQTFLQNILDEKHSQLFCEIIKDIVMKKLSFTLFEELDKETATKVYAFLMKYRIILNISPDILERLGEIVSANAKEDHVSRVFHLKPTLSDLFNNNIYKLYVEDKLYLVPLWHSEIYFDGENITEILVLCEPELEENISIDEYNNVYTNIEIAFSTIIELMNNNNPLTFVLCNNNTMSIPIDKLFMKKEQLYKFKKGGISKIKGNNIHDVDDKADVIVTIKLIN